MDTGVAVKLGVLERDGGSVFPPTAGGGGSGGGSVFPPAAGGGGSNRAGPAAPVKLGVLERVDVVPVKGLRGPLKCHVVDGAPERKDLVRELGVASEGLERGVEVQAERRQGHRSARTLKSTV